MEKSVFTKPGVVEVVYSPEARQVVCKEVDWAVLADEQKNKPVNVQDVVLASGMLEHCSELCLDSLSIGIWGKRATLASAVEVGDRIEIYRDLIVDPKEARRLRHEKHGASGAPRYRPGYRGQA